MYNVVCTFSMLTYYHWFILTLYSLSVEMCMINPAGTCIFSLL